MKRVLLLLALLPFAALAQQCPNGERLANICMTMSSMSRDAGGELNYQKLVMQAACVADSGDEATTSRKVQQMWSRYQDKLVCSNTRFDVQDGSMLKFAVSMRNEDFLFDAACMWKVDLNRIDPSDGRTVLDYTFDEYIQHQDSVIGKTLKSYYDLLRHGCEGGRKTIVARHRDELCAADGPRPEGCSYTPRIMPPCGTPGRDPEYDWMCEGYDYYKASGVDYEEHQARRQKLLRKWMNGDME